MAISAFRFLTPGNLHLRDAFHSLECNLDLRVLLLTCTSWDQGIISVGLLYKPLLHVCFLLDDHQVSSSNPGLSLFIPYFTSELEVLIIKGAASSFLDYLEDFRVGDGHSFGVDCMLRPSEEVCLFWEHRKFAHVVGCGVIHVVALIVNEPVHRVGSAKQENLLIR